VDTELEIIRIEDAPKGILHISKQKDGEDGQRMGFQMVTVDIGTSALGFESVTSLALELDGEMDVNQQRKQATPPNRAGLGHNNQLGLKALHAAIKKFGTMEQVDGKRNKCIKIEQWRLEFRASMGNDVDSEVFRKLFWRVKTQLTNAKKLFLKITSKKMVTLGRSFQSNNRLQVVYIQGQMGTPYVADKTVHLWGAGLYTAPIS
jgi:hypothetical protein